MAVPGQNHRDPWFAEFYKACMEDSKFIYNTKTATSFIFPGTGTGGWEAALCNTLSPGDKVVCFRYGLFSHLWIDMMQRLGLDVTVVDRPWGEGADEGILEEMLRKDTEKKIKAVCVVHNETTTGVTSDIAGCRKAMDNANHPALLLVDGVSSIGALDFRMDDWRVDVAVTGSQKALSLPTGLAFVAASPKVGGRTRAWRIAACQGERWPHAARASRAALLISTVCVCAPQALEAMKSAKLKRVYYDFADMLRTNPSGSVPYTPSLPLLYGMRESIALLREEGLDNVVARHHRRGFGKSSGAVMQLSAHALRSSSSASLPAA